MNSHMLKRRNFLLVALTAAGVLAACDAPPDGRWATDDDDQAGRPPANVVALMRSLADMWLLAGGTLAGITEDARDLEGVGDAQVVGSLSRPSLEQIVALSPGLVLATSDIPAQVELRSSLVRQGIDCIDVDVNSLDDYASHMRRFCDTCGRDDLYQVNVADVVSACDAVRARAKDLPEARYLALRTSSAKSKALKQNHFACRIFDDLNMQNIADDGSSLDELSLEAVQAADPAYVFVIYQGDEDKAREAYEEGFSSRSAWQGLKATLDGHVFVLPKELFQYKPNARWADAYRYALELRSRE